MSYKKALETETEALKDALESNCGYKIEKCQFVICGDKKPEVHIVAKSRYRLEEDEE